MRRSLPRLFAQLCSIPLTLLFVSYTYSQVPSNKTKKRISVRTVITQDARSREWIPVITRLEEDPQQQRRAQLALRADFRQLQLVNLELIKLVAKTHQSVDKKSQQKIKTNLGEIKKLAARLRIRLGIPEVEREAGQAPGTLALVPGIILLDKAITSFVENPLFQQPKVFDSELAMKAGNDANEIARLADLLRSRL